MAEETEEKDGVIRKIGRILNAMGLSSQNTIENQAVPSEVVEPIKHGIMSEAELSYFAKKTKDGNRTQSLKVEDLRMHLDTITNNTKERTRNNHNIRALTPEIAQADSILTSSIMSPNDMQTDRVQINSDLENIDVKLNEEASEMITDYFNDKLDFAQRMSNWCSKSNYGPGAVPTVIMPRKNINLLSHVSNVGMENYLDFSSNAEGLESYSLNDDILNKWFDNDPLFDEDITMSLEAQGLDLPANSTGFVQDVKKGLKSFLKGTNNSVSFHADPASLDANSAVNNKKTDEISKSIMKHFLGEKDEEKIMVLTTETTGEEDETPLDIEFPTEAVIPVSMPGDITKRAGYYVLMDEWMKPISYDEKGIQSSLQKDIPQATADAMFGKRDNLLSNVTAAKRNETIEAIFSISLQRMMENNLKDLGYSGLTLGEYQGASKCLLRKLVQKKKVNLIFVPDPLMVYFCFNHREDGTGKSLIEDAEFILGLRSTLLLSGVMAGIKNSQDAKTINLELDNHTTNVEQIMEIVRNEFVNKRMFRFDNNPTSTLRDIISKSLEIVPKGIKGLENFSIETSRNGANVQEPDDNLLERLTSMGITSLDVPHSALNALSEDEYSRSIATSNLFFSNKVRLYQRIAKKHGTKYVRAYCTFSGGIKARLREIIKKYSTGEAGKDDLTSDPDAMVYRIIHNLTVYLPPPTVSVDKAHYEELRDLISLIDDLIDRAFPDELIGGTNRDLKETMAPLRALLKRDMLGDAVQRMGLQGSIAMPTLDDINMTGLKDMQLMAKGLEKKFKSIDDVFKEEGDDDSSSGGSSW